jgi:hypothetical protein
MPVPRNNSECITLSRIWRIRILSTNDPGNRPSSLPSLKLGPRSAPRVALMGPHDVLYPRDVLALTRRHDQGDGSMLHPRIVIAGPSVDCAKNPSRSVTFPGCAADRRTGTHMVLRSGDPCIALANNCSIKGNNASYRTETAQPSMVMPVSNNGSHELVESIGV